MAKIIFTSYMSASDLYILYKALLGETGCLGNPSFIYWFPKHPVLLFTLTQSVRLPMVTYPWLCSTCDLRDTMPRHWSPVAFHPNLYLGKQRISLGVAIILSICLRSHTYLDCNQFVIHLKFVFIHVNIAKFLLVVKNLIKKY